MLCHINLGQNSRSALRVILENGGESTLIQSQSLFNVVIFFFLFDAKVSSSQIQLFKVNLL